MKHILVTGGAGFIGSHLCDVLIEKKSTKLWVVDNLLTGSDENIKHLKNKDNFEFINADVSQPTSEYLPKDVTFDQIYHLASPASPRGYQDNPVSTYMVNSFGTHYLADLASKHQARFFFASTSEVYGDPKEHPQKESYWGNVHIRGVRACYDVSKRFGEMVQTVWHREKDLDTRTVRIFNTYGPRMDPKDGRVFPNFITQALKGDPITVYGDGSQTRSFCYVSDLVAGFLELMENEATANDAFNLGNTEEHTMIDMAKLIKKLTKSDSEIVFKPLPQDDPQIRRPDISKIQTVSDWTPKVSLEEGLMKTIEYFRNELT